MGNGIRTKQAERIAEHGMEIAESARRKGVRERDVDLRTIPRAHVISPATCGRLKAQPVSNVLWLHRSELVPNHYNPNTVAPPELELLIVSILEDGYTQPIVALPFGNIVDGFHRWLTSEDSRLIAVYDGFVPVAFVELDKTHRMMSTIRHNRARGTHGVIRMGEIVATMVEDGVSMTEIQKRLQMEDEEVERLACRVGIPQKYMHQEFGQSWTPSDKKVPAKIVAPPKGHVVSRNGGGNNGTAKGRK